MEEKLLNIMNSLADPTRLKIIHILSYGNFCAIHLENIIGVGQSNISRHSQKLVNSKIVKATPKGRRVVYSLNENFKLEYKELIKKINKIYNEKIEMSVVEQNQVDCIKLNGR